MDNWFTIEQIDRDTFSISEYNMPCSRDLNGPYTRSNTQGRHLYLFLPLPTGTADVLQMYAAGHKVWAGPHRIRICLPSEGTF